MKESQMLRGIVCVFVMFSTLTQTTLAATKDDYYALYKYLFDDINHPYNKDIRPATNETHVITVQVELSVNSIINVDEKEQTLVTSGTLHMTWEDSNLAWENSKDRFGDITDLLVPQTNIYLPDVIVANSVRTAKQLGYFQQQIRIGDVGTISWEPSLLMVTSCDLDITYFPFDTQVCFIIFKTAVTSNSEIFLELTDKEVPFYLGEFSQNGQWELVGISSKELNDQGFKASVQFGLQLKRRRVFYVLNIVLPIFFLSLTSSLVFALPADEGEKMGTGITILLSFAVYLTVVSDLVPNTSLQVSILAVYLTSLTGMSAVSVVVCTFILRLHFRDQDLPVGHKTTRLTRFLQKMMCSNKDGDTANNQVVPVQREGTQTRVLEKTTPQHQDNQNDVTPSVGEISAEEDEDPITWKDVAKTMDDFCFIIFSFLTIFTTVFCLMTLIVGGEMSGTKLKEPIFG